MFTFVQGARAMTAVCVSAVTFFGAPATATADPTDNNKLFALLLWGLHPGRVPGWQAVSRGPFPRTARLRPQHSARRPNAATYSLYGNIADLNKTFNQYGASIPCPGTTDPGPIAWQGGMVKCGHDLYPQQSQSMLTWTKNADLLVVNAEGPDLASLYAWWLSAR